MVLGEGDLPTVKFEKKGTEGNPWAVGKTTLDSVSAWTNGVGGLVVEGEGNMQDFTEGDPAPWGTDLTEVEIGEDVTSIGARAFADSQLGRVTIPASVTNIGAAAFAGSTSLSSVAVEAMTPPALGKEAFVELAEDYKIYVPQGTVETYKAAPGWRDYADRIVEGIPGSPVWPWKVGTPKAADVTAYTNGVGKLVVEGWGDIRDFDPPSDSAPWGTDIAEVKIDEDVTSIGANAFADCMSLTNMVVEAMTPPVLGDDALSGCAAIETIYVPYGTSGAYKKAPGWNDFAENIVELPEPIAAESEEFTVDLRTRIEFEEGKTRIDVVTWSATAWGAVPGSKYTDLGFTNKTTGATGVIAEGLVGENLDDCPLPEKDGEYLLTHSTGDLKSFVTFVVSGYPLGCKSNPWTVGPVDDPERTVAWKDGKDAIVYLKPPRSAVSRTGLETLTNAMGGVNFAVGLVTADGTATNEVKMIIGASGKQYTKLEDMLESEDDSWTFYDVTGCVVTYDGMGHSGTMASDTFIPGIPTNLTANAYTAFGYEFQGWTTNGDTKVVFEDEAAIDDPQPGDIYDLKAVWKLTPVTVGKGVTAYLDENGVLHIKGKGAMKDFTDTDPAPWAEFAPDIKAIEVEEGVTKIGNAAFDSLDYKATTTALTFQDEDHVLNLLAFVSADGSKTNAPEAKAFSVYKDSSGTVEPIVAFQTLDMVYVYTKVPTLMRYGYDEVLLLTLPDLKAVRTAELIETAGELPYSKTMQGLLDEALDKIDKATNYDEVMDGYVERLNQIEAQAEKDKPNEIEGSKITWRVLDGTLYISGEGEMPDFTEPDYPEGAPWDEMKADITNVTVAAGIASIGDAAFAVCPAYAESSVLFKDPEAELNLGAFVSGDGSVTNVPTVKVEIVTEDGRTLRVAPGGWTNADDPNVTYDSLAEAIEDGATTVVAAFEKKTDEGEKAVPPAEVEEIVKTVTDPDDPEKEIELTATYENVPTAEGSTAGLVSEIENLPLIVDNTGSNITVVVTATNKN
ncbi:MAG: leucine-rich repeat protein, partial [bacterium]|nr:leucine-rich repeat protein [Candidatus Colisoma equi]